VHDLSVILYLLGEEPSEAGRARERFLHPGVEDVVFCLPPLPEREDRAHAPLVARPAQDAQDDRRRPREDGGVRRHGARAQGDDLREGAVGAAETYGEWRTRTGDIFSPKIANDEPLRLELQHFLRLVEEGPGTSEARRARRRGRRALETCSDDAPA
jgi:predicted dehydrogenase